MKNRMEIYLITDGNNVKKFEINKRFKTELWFSKDLFNSMSFKIIYQNIRNILLGKKQNPKVKIKTYKDIKYVSFPFIYGNAYLVFSIGDNKIETLQELCQKTTYPINISKIVTFGFEKDFINENDDKVNYEHYNKMIKINKNWDKYQVPVGYQIHNIGKNPITIDSPVYNLERSTGKYKLSKIEQIILSPNSECILPTEFLIRNLIKLYKIKNIPNEKTLKLNIGNGSLKEIKVNLNEKDLDYEKYRFRCMYFEPFGKEWIEYFESPLSKYQIGAYPLKNIGKSSLKIPEEKMKKLFGYLLNGNILNFNKKEEKND